MENKFIKTQEKASFMPSAWRIGPIVPLPRNPKTTSGGRLYISHVMGVAWRQSHNLTHIFFDWEQKPKTYFEASLKWATISKMFLIPGVFRLGFIQTSCGSSILRVRSKI